MTVPTTRRLTRSAHDKWIGGVCGGIAEYFGWNSTVVRLLFVLSCLLPGPQFVIYLVMWLIIPKK
ncbi:PspC domain-containing protein [Nocardia arthritidis]|uniref:PspC domain-containing protein n=1 Tax=Nocardia arthritidis TaxID=228602 RepID=A0A6G9Y7I0_9NOCA|nr:PspC domain-containing protein [Nocardia arthritidis]QIS09070.1 PspC domain-containing protein [Nocardia arthritidis]